MKKIVYIPLDNRPVCVDRIILQAKSCGFEIIIPDIDMVSTKLDGQPLNKNNTQHGDTLGMFLWLKNNISDDVETYIISIDQLLSGGLVNSRSITNDDISFEKQVIDELFGQNGLLRNKRCYLFDTVMRLASTVGYKGYFMDEYSSIRRFARLERFQFDDKNLTLDNIFKSYNLDLNGNEIELPEDISEEKRTKYYSSRKRKLSISNYIAENLKNTDNIYYICGIDDSNPTITIQTNEIRYLSKLIEGFGNVIIGTDELASMLLCRFMVDYYGYSPKVKLVFFGDQIDVNADAYDNGTLRTNLYNHLDYMKIDYNNEDNAEIEIVVVTKPSETSPYEINVKNAIDYVENNIKNDVITILIDCTTWDLYGKLERELSTKKFIGGLLSYSNWNTVANAVGLALGQGLSRFIYLKEGYNKETEFVTAKAFIELLSISYLKDMGYKIGCNKMFNNYVYERAFNENGQKEDNSFMNFYKYLKYSKKLNYIKGIHKCMNSKENPCNSKMIIKNICGNKVLTKYHKDKNLREYYIVKNIKNISYDSPWYRHFEINIFLNCKIKKLSY